MDLATRLKTTRKKLGLSQSALADATGVSQPTVANWERGGHIPRQDALGRIADALGTDTAWLLTGELAAPQNPAHQHLAKPIHHIPVFEWPLDEKDPTESQPARYLSVAMDADGVFGLDGGGDSGFPAGSILLCSKTDRRVPGRFLTLKGGRYRFEDRGSLDDVFARLIYSVVPH